jgi:hypothetical protein
MINDATTGALSIADAYHQRWTSKRFAEAMELLSPNIDIEVPINSYPTRESFTEALKRFGSLAEQVSLLSALAGENEAMLLYDMRVEGLGTLRVAEHFTVHHGVIVKLRQIHDTAPIRAAGFGGGA